MSEFTLPVPQGACRRSGRLSAVADLVPNCDRLDLVLFFADGRREIALRSEPDNCFVHREERIEDGQRYAYRPPGGRELPDPASRWQPDGVHALRPFSRRAVSLGATPPGRACRARTC